MKNRLTFAGLPLLLAFCVFSCDEKPRYVESKIFGYDSLKNLNSFAAQGLREGGTVELGTGYNSATDEFAALNVADEANNGTKTDSSGGDQSAIFQATLVSTLSDLRNTLDMGFNASGGFGPFSASAKASFLSESHITTTSDYLLVKVKITSYSEQFKKPALSGEAIRRLAGDAVSFFKYAGDEYVYEKIYGGEYYVLFAAESFTKSEQNENRQSLSAAYSIFSAGGDRKQLSQSLNKVKRLSIKICRSGARDDGLSGSATVDSVLQAAFDFPKEVRKHPTLIAINTKPIYTLPGWPVTRNEPEILPQKSFLNDIVRKRWEIEDLLSTLRYVASTKGSVFPDSLRNKAGLLSHDLQTRIVNLQRCQSTCALRYRLDDCGKCAELIKPLPPFLVELADSSAISDPVPTNP